MPRNFVTSILLLFVLAAHVAAANVKIMCFGASIVGAPGCWRASLWKKLQDNNIKNTDFVGSNKAPDCGFPYDGENEGHAGAKAADYAADGRLVGWLNAAKPDIIVMHLGTNDVLAPKTPAETIAAYDVLINQMRASKPSMKIIVSQLIPLDPKKFNAKQVQGIVDLNKAIVDWAPKRSSRQSPIIVVDNFTGFNTATDTIDGEHPNDAGNQKLASKFYQPVADQIKSVG
ncbi:SGNH hydrolase [Corynespora cassiicola Philippines]|uniref:SGNH hydrolase n=1 Tax=Corynespora cassiicola Philippines TaxID=1448308 RepID=A0A2T2N9K0_CORCC|nr:SGNH hydrolase [Corynespora cassiicola Philippines]